MLVFRLFPSVGTFPFFSCCASHVPSSCGNSSESRLDLFGGLSPVTSDRGQREDCLPLWALLWGFLLIAGNHRWPVSSWPPSSLKIQRRVVFCRCVDKLYHWVWFYCDSAVIQGTEGSLWLLPSPQKITCNHFSAGFEFLLLGSAWHCTLV